MHAVLNDKEHQFLRDTMYYVFMIPMMFFNNGYFYLKELLRVYPFTLFEPSLSTAVQCRIILDHSGSLPTSIIT